MCNSSDLSFSLFVLAMLTTNLPNLVSKETDSDSAAGLVKKTKHSKLGEFPQNLLDDDDKEVQGLSKVMSCFMN